MTDVIEQVRAAREAVAAEYGYDLPARGAALREMDARGDWVVVSLPPRPVEWPVVIRPPVQAPA